MKVVLRPEYESFSRTRVAWRAFEGDGTPMYMGAETLAEIEQRVRDLHPEADLWLGVTANELQVMRAHNGQAGSGQDLPDGTWYTLVRTQLLQLTLLEELVVGGGTRRAFLTAAAKGYLDRDRCTVWASSSSR